MCIKALEDLVKNAHAQSPPTSASVGVVPGLVPGRDPHIYKPSAFLVPLVYKKPPFLMTYKCVFPVLNKPQGPLTTFERKEKIKKI